MLSDAVDISLVAAVAVCLTSLAGGLFRGFSGFGSGLILSPVLALVVGPALAIPAAMLVFQATSLQLLPGAWRHVDWKIVTPLAVASALTHPIGIYGLVALDPDITRRVISTICVVFALVLLAGWTLREAARPGVSALVGASSGLINGIGAVGGPPVILYLLALGQRAAAIRATVIVYFTLTQFVGIAAYLIGGLIDLETLVVCLLIGPPMVLGVWAGEKLFGRTDDALYRRIALVFLLFVGVATLLI